MNPNTQGAHTYTWLRPHVTQAASCLLFWAWLRAITYFSNFNSLYHTPTLRTQTHTQTDLPRAHRRHFRRRRLAAILESCTHVLLCLPKKPGPSQERSLSFTLSWVLSQAEGGRARKRQTAEKTREAEISPNYGQSWPKCFELYSCNCVNIVCDWVTPSDWVCVCVCWSLTCSYDLALWLTSACIPKKCTEQDLCVSFLFYLYFYTYQHFSSVLFLMFTSLN